MTIGVVTDSACDLPDELVDRYGIEVVPLTVRFGDLELVDRVELSTADFWSRLRDARELPSTAAPSAGAFATSFRRLVDQGATAIVCISLSERLSATMQSAQLGAAELADGGIDVPIEVIDSRNASMGLGSLVLGAAQRAEAGEPLDAIVAAVLGARDRSRLVGTLDTLEFLKRGGRIGNAQALLGSVLAIKPLVELRDGVVEEAGKVRTRSRALRFLADRVAAQPVTELAVLHGQATDVEGLLELLDPIIPAERITVGEVGPVIGTHAGPGVIGVSFQVAATA